MHALLVAKMGNVPYEPFFYGEIVAEIGFEMEKRLFSGRPTLIFNGDEGRIYHHYTRNRRSVNTTLVGIPVLFEYPDRGLIDEYRSENDYIGVRTGPNLNEDHLPTYDLAWRIDIARVERYLRNDFWANLPPDDNTALHLPKDLGYYFANEAGDNDRVPRIPDIDDLPDGYNMTANGDVVPLRAGQQRRTRRPRIR